MLDSHQFNVFLTAAETLNFTQAAQRLNMSQPSVSQHIQSLEKHFQMKLFTRVGRRIQLTDAGMALVPLARDFVNQSIRIDEAMSSLKGSVYGHLIVGCSTTPGKYILPMILASFHKIHPNVRITCQVTSQNEALDSLLEGKVHFAMTSLPQRMRKETEFFKYLSDSIKLITPTDHPWANCPDIEPGDLSSVDFIMREPDSGTYIAVEEALSKFDIHPKDLSTVLTLGSSEAIALSVREGLGVGFVSDVILNNLGSDQISCVHVQNLDIQREIYMGRNISKPQTSAQKVFWEFIKTQPFPESINISNAAGKN